MKPIRQFNLIIFNIFSFKLSSLILYSLYLRESTYRMGKQVGQYIQIRTYLNYLKFKTRKKYFRSQKNSLNLIAQTQFFCIKIILQILQLNSYDNPTLSKPVQKLKNCQVVKRCAKLRERGDLSKNKRWMYFIIKYFYKFAFFSLII